MPLRHIVVSPLNDYLINFTLIKQVSKAAGHLAPVCHDPRRPIRHTLPICGACKRVETVLHLHQSVQPEGLVELEPHIHYRVTLILLLEEVARPKKNG
jgi:hypothetical protein